MRTRTELPGLSFYLPEPSKKHTILHIPGSHTLYVGPSSCMRRHAIHASMYGDRNNVSFLALTETDIITGDYELVLADAILKLIETLENPPHIFIIAVFCIDDFLGTDEDALISSLSGEFGDRIFAMEHIDPVTIGENMKEGLMKTHFNMYSFIRPVPLEDRDMCVDFIGTFSSLDPECDFTAFLKSLGVPKVRELHLCRTFEEYEDLGRSRLAIGMRLVAESTVKFITDVLKIDYYYFTACYDVDYVKNGYYDIYRLLTGKSAGCTEEGRKDTGAGESAASTASTGSADTGSAHTESTCTDSVCNAVCIENIPAMCEETRSYAIETAKLLNDAGIELIIDCKAFLTPFRTALALIKYGFRVKYILHGKHRFPFDQEAYEKILSDCPDITIVHNDDYENMFLEEKDRHVHCLAFGADSKRIFMPEFYADVWHDEGYFGFHGIKKLMKLMREACFTKRPHATGCATDIQS